MAALKRNVGSGDRVVVVGGGYGVTAVTAARQSRAEKPVVVYEPAQKRRKIVRETIRRAGLADSIVVEPLAVGEASKGQDRETVLPPEGLPPSDVLELDCEGAELSILRNLDHRPRWIHVESHGHKGATSEDVEDQLGAIGYEVTDTRVASDDQRTHCMENDIMVLTARARSTG